MPRFESRYLHFSFIFPPSREGSSLRALARALARDLDRDLDRDLGRALVLDQIPKKLNLGVNIQPDIP